MNRSATYLTKKCLESGSLAFRSVWQSLFAGFGKVVICFQFPRQGPGDSLCDARSDGREQLSLFVRKRSRLLLKGINLLPASVLQTSTQRCDRGHEVFCFDGAAKFVRFHRDQVAGGAGRGLGVNASGNRQSLPHYGIEIGACRSGLLRLLPGLFHL